LLLQARGCRFYGLKDYSQRAGSTLLFEQEGPHKDHFHGNILRGTQTRFAPYILAEHTKAIAAFWSAKLMRRLGFRL